VTEHGQVGPQGVEPGGEAVVPLAGGPPVDEDAQGGDHSGDHSGDQGGEPLRGIERSAVGELPLSERWLWAPQTLPWPLRGARALLAASAAPCWGAAMSARRVIARRKGTTRQPPCPVVCVGSVVVGGVGKTEVVAWCAQALAEAQRRVLIVSRGYGRIDKYNRVIQPNERGEWPPWQEAGDEPLMLAQRLNAHRVTVASSSAPRWAALQWAFDTLGPFDVALFDDGLQGLDLAHTLNIAVVPPEVEALTLMPTGPLRENVDQMFRLQAPTWVWVHAGDGAHVPPEIAIRGRVADVTSRYALKRFYSQSLQKYIHIQSLPKGERILVSAVARNANVARLLTRSGVNFNHHLSFPDHHPLSLPKILNKSPPPILLTTPKDWPRLAPILSSPPLSHLLPLTFLTHTTLSLASPSPSTLRDNLLSALSPTPQQTPAGA
jgi:tetraacyldisaccharide 4'-kinase